MSNLITLGLDADLLASGVRSKIRWDYARCPHAVVFGATGSGKTYFTRLLLAKIGKFIPDSEIVVCDFKADDDFSFLSGCPGFFRFDGCSEGLEAAVEKLKARQRGADASRSFFLMMFDEWAAYLNSLDKKAAEAAKQKLSYLLMLGRSFNVHVLISQQRVDAAYFNAARDNFSLVVGLGRLSRESVQMMFSDFRDEIYPVKPRGQGTALVGDRIFNMVVPQVTTPLTVEEAILSAVQRPEGRRDEN